MRSTSLAVRIMIAVLMLAAFGASAAGAASAIPVPANDPFYVPPAGYQTLPNGVVLRDRKINAEYLSPFFSTEVLTQFGIQLTNFLPSFYQLQNLKINAYQVLYKSTDGHNQPVAEAATILVPQGSWNGGGTRPVVSYQLDEDSVTTNCEPSYTLRTGLMAQQGGAGTAGQFEVSLSLVSLLQGYAVVYSDYEGPQSQWIAGLQEGHGVLDGIRAALAYAPAGLSTRTPVGLWGYSGGAGATGWAAEQAQSYAPELNIVGAAIGANPNSDLTRMYLRNDGTLVDGLLVMAIVGLDRAYPEAGIDAYLNPAGQQLLAGAQNQCTFQAAIQYSFTGPIENYTINPAVKVPDSAPGQIIFPANSLVDQAVTPTIPILNYHDEFDELVPVAADDELALKYCQAGAAVEVMRTSTPTPFVALVHIAGEIEGDLPALTYLGKRFKHMAPRNDCPAASKWSTGNGLPYYPYVTQ
jgi:hypothetical protein